MARLALLTSSRWAWLASALPLLAMAYLIARYRQRKSEASSEELPGESELIAACRVWEQQLAANADTTQSRKLRMLLRQAYGVLDTLYSTYESGGTALLRAQPHPFEHDSDSTASSESFLSATDIDLQHDQPPSGPVTPFPTPAHHPAERNPHPLHRVFTPQHPAAAAAAAAAEDAIEPLALAAPKYAQQQQQHLFEHSQARVRDGEVRCRKIRLAATGCPSESHFLACVASIRAAFRVVLESEADRTWLHATGTAMIARLLQLSGRSPQKFEAAQENILRFVRDALAADSGQSILSELSSRGVAEVSFYDIVLDFTFLDALEDLEDPPSALTTVMRAWVPQAVKQGMLDAAVAVVVATKRKKASANGFMLRYYDVMEEISPVLAWGLLGPASPLATACHRLKESIVAFTADMFRLAPSAATAPELAAAILAEARRHTAEIFATLPT